MPLIMQFTRYTKWVAIITRWTECLYNRLISDGVANIAANRTACQVMAKGDRDYLLCRLPGKVTENARRPEEDSDAEPIRRNLVARLMWDMYEESPGEPISRIMDKISDIGVATRKELDLRLRNPEGIRHWVGKKRKSSNEQGYSYQIKKRCDIL